MLPCLKCGKDLEDDEVNGSGSTIAQDINRRGGSRITYQDGAVKDQQVPAPNTSTLTPRHGDGEAGECGGFSCRGQDLFTIAPQGRGYMHGGSAEARSEQLGHGTPDLHSDGRDSNWREHEDQEQFVQQPSIETAPGRTFGGSQDGGDAHDLVQSGGSRGEPWCSGYARVRIDHY